MGAARAASMKGAIIMTRCSGRRKIAALVLGLSLTGPLAAASNPRAPTETGAEVTAPSLWALLDKLWEFLSAGSRSKCGAMPDPNGGCASQPVSGGSSTSPDAGASADPDG